jgi:Ca2+-transporting ATPase
MLVAALVGLPLPLLPLHLLWINIVTDGLPALALVMDPPEEGVLSRPPRNPSEPMLGRAQWQFIVMTGVLEAAMTLAIFTWALTWRDLTEARSLAFATLVFAELFRAFGSRSPTRTFWEVGAFTNLRLLGAVVVSAGIQVAIHYVPATQTFFQIGTLPLADGLLALLVGLCPVTLIELRKLVRRFVHRV